MFIFEPKRLQAVVEKVEKQHPIALQDYRSPEFAASNLGQELARKLLAVSQTGYAKVLQELTIMERTLFAGLLHDERRQLQMRILYGLVIDPKLGRVLHLWKFLENHFGNDLTKMTAEVITNHPNVDDELDTIQIDFCQAIVDGEDYLEFFWRRLMDLGEVRREFEDPVYYQEGSTLCNQLLKHFFLRGSHHLWEAVSKTSFQAKVAKFTIGQVVDTIIASHRIFKQHRSLEGAYWIYFFIGMLGPPGSQLWKELENQSPETANWYRSLRVQRELTEFFATHPDNERFDFWKSYMGQLRDARGDIKNKRLFLDFGSFGIIEFAEVGNAAYVYRADYFHQMQKMNFRPKPIQHGSLKNRERALKRLSHFKGWQQRFKRLIDSYLRQI